MSYSYFQENGYIIIENFIDERLIDKVLHELDLVKKTSNLFYSQNNHRVHKFNSCINDDGLLINSIQSPSKHLHLQGLRKSVLDVITAPSITNLLQELTGSKSKLVLYQDMLFDRSTGTLDHRDTWYLDSKPRGAMNAIWIALEDISSLSGPFHVYKGSNKTFCIDEVDEVYKSGTEEVAEKIISENKLLKVPAIIKKGTILVWNSYTLHGSENPKDDFTSRKSITAHYYPIGERVNLEKNSIKSLKKDINSLIPSQNSDLYILNSYENNRIRFMKDLFKRYLKDFWRKNLPPINPMQRSK